MIVLFALFLLSFCILLFYYLIFFSKIAFSQLSNHRIAESSNRAVSVIICARNELKNLQQFLLSILNQDYPEYEVIVVNDRSTDDSQQWLEALSKQYPRLRVIENSFVEKNLPGKRSALKKGLEASRYEIILLTDADCRPASREWIKMMAGALTEQSEIILGFSPCLEQKALLNRFIRYENFQTALNYLSFAEAGFPYMGIGRNLLYRKSVAQQIGAFEHHSGLMTGDDDLMVNRIANSRNTSLMIHPQSHVFTVPPTTLQEFIRQKRRHYGAGFHYRLKHKIALGVMYASQMGFNLAIIPLLLSGFMLTVTIVIFIVKNILQLFIYGNAMRRLNVQNLWIFTPVFDACLSLFFLTLGSLSFLKIKTWK